MVGSAFSSTYVSFVFRFNGNWIDSLMKTKFKVCAANIKIPLRITQHRSVLHKLPFSLKEDILTTVTTYL